MDILVLLDALEDEIEGAKGMIFTSKACIDREKCLDLIRDIRLNLPDEVKKAQWIKNERQRILIDAQREAETIIKDAESKIKFMVDESEISKRAYEQSQIIISNAQQSAKEIRFGSTEYADKVLKTLEKNIEKILESVRNNRQELKGGKPKAD
ncbi:MAG: ATPase [Mahellales bacterium]|jgi:vacuolar-type H+-ATPase subunit H